jgi:glycosyltransferase involved in cell wall biosynthesis
MNSDTEKPILFVLLSRFPYPLEKGDKLRAYYQLRELSENHRIVLVCLTELPVPAEFIEKIRVYCMEVQLFRIRKAAVYLRLLFNFFSSLPFQVAYFQSFTIKNKIHALLKKYQPQHIYCQLVRTSEFVKNYHHCPKTIDYMDAFSVGMERRAERSGWIMRILWQEEAKRLRNYERKIFDYFEGHSIISEQDRSFIVHPDSNRIAIIPNGIDSSFYETIDTEPTYDLVFIGNLSYPPNIEAANYLFKEILPNLPGKTLLLAGATPDPSLTRMASRTKNIHLLGWTEDIRKTYKLGKIFIAPMHIGTGMQNKLLEAMALGIPCITTSLANNAIKGIHREHLLVADTKKEILQAVEELLTNKLLKDRITLNACEYVKSNYSWPSTVRLLEDIIQTKG